MDAFNSTVQDKYRVRPVFWAGLALIALVLTVAYAYWAWYYCLRARMAASIHDALQAAPAFFRAKDYLAIALPSSWLVYEFTRRHLSRSWRWAWVILLGLGCAFFAVPWILRRFGPTPFWR